MMEAEFTVLGDPKGKQRPRVIHGNRGVTTYTPRQTVMYENLVRISYAEQCKGVFLEGAIEAHITAFFAVPKSESKKRRFAMLQRLIMHTKKIDCDNLAKVVLDSLNSVAYHDDAQVARLIVEKYYGEIPQVQITLKEICQTY